MVLFIHHGSQITTTPSISLCKMWATSRWKLVKFKCIVYNIRTVLGYTSPFQTLGSTVKRLRREWITRLSTCGSRPSLHILMSSSFGDPVATHRTLPQRYHAVPVGNPLVVFCFKYRPLSAFSTTRPHHCSVNVSTIRCTPCS